LPAAGSGPIVLGSLTASVPQAAVYTSKDMLQLTVQSLTNASGTVPATGTNAMHLVAYPGDATEDGHITSADSVLLNQVEIGTITGFSKYRLVDANLIGDLTGSGMTDAAAVSALNQYILNYQQSSEIPPIPILSTGYPTFPASPDPTLSIPSALQVGADGSLSVPVNIDDPRPAGSDGMTVATLALTYDPAIFRVSSSDIQLGSVPASGSGWTLQSVVDAAAGQIGVTIWSTTPIASSAAGSLVTIDFHRSGLAAAGTTTIDLVNSVNPNGHGSIYTEVGDDLSNYTLSPAPTNAYNPQIDGLVTVSDTPLAGTTGRASAAQSLSLRQSRSSLEHLADDLFTALGGGALDPAELAILGSGAEQTVGRGLAAEMSAAGSTQTKLDRLLWGSEETSWLDGKCEWLS
jgi:hypothetical protein